MKKWYLFYSTEDALQKLQQLVREMYFAENQSLIKLLQVGGEIDAQKLYQVGKEIEPQKLHQAGAEFPLPLFRIAN